MKDHTVEQGDCVASIAFENGFFWQTVWNDGANTALNQNRKDPFTLEPGDVVRIPDLRNALHECATDKRHRFRLKGVPQRVRLRLLDAQGQPRASESYTLEIDGKPFQGKTDANGKIDHPISPKAKEGKLVLASGTEMYHLNLGYLEPIDTVTGVQGRLRNLGFYRGALDGQSSPELAEAILDFQDRTGIDPTGEMDDRTRQALQNSFGG